MNKLLKEAIDSLTSVRKLITLLLTGVFCYLALENRIGADSFKDVYLIIIGFYFAKSTALDIPGKFKK